jgi:DMSO/TMAO reductase YedYZ molybdopterin-dependent catalytic subunit
MSPTVLARFPWYGKLFGGKQGARSLHFLGLVAFAAFVVIHVFMVIVHGVPREFAAVVLGGYQHSHTLALAIGLTGLFLILVFHIVITVLSLRYKRATQRLLGLMVNPFERVLSRSFTSRERYGPADISSYHWVNGYPPPGAHYQALAADGFRDYRLAVGGLVENPVSLSLADLRHLAQQSQITKHNCIQGWTSIAEWGGVPLSLLMDLVGPTPAAKYVVFYAMDDKGLTEGEGRYGFFYGTVPLHLATNPQTILALEMNGAPLPVAHGAPVRVRIETQLGFKMVKWIRAIEFVADYRDIGMGQGGWREDQQFYANAAGI